MHSAVCRLCQFPLSQSSVAEERDAAEDIICKMCAGCEEDLVDPAESRALKVAAFQESAQDLLNAIMAKAGVPPKFQRASITLIPPQIRERLSKDLVDSLMNGAITGISNGQGLGCSIGGGKTSAWGAMIGLGVMRWIHAINKDWNQEKYMGGWLRTKVPFPTITWAHWPTAADKFQMDATNSTYLREQMKNCRLLVLDDLGCERIPVLKDEYSTPYSISQLQLIIDHRNSHMLPILWTTNVKSLELAKIYGLATYTRLIEDNPLEWIEEPLDNLRLK